MRKQDKKRFDEIAKAVAAAGKEIGCPAPYKVEALYDEQGGAGAKMVVFSDANKKQWYTTYQPGKAIKI